MKQTIRENCFETNSSSYHTLTIQKIKGDIPRREIEKGKNLIINNAEINKVKLISWSESYKCVARSSFEKAQLVLRFMGYEIDNQLSELVDENDYRNPNGSWNREKRDELMKKAFYDTPLVKAFINAIKRYIGQDYNVVIEFNEDWSPYIIGVSDEGKSFKELFGLSDESDINDVEKMTEIFYNIIFDPNTEMIEECESNE